MRFKRGKKRSGVDHGGLHHQRAVLAHALDHRRVVKDDARFVADNRLTVQRNRQRDDLNVVFVELRLGQVCGRIGIECD
ncbi:hypothetical protein SDC9_169244 [bioreactor metagenome]|uniref:Uncharacterized protein n=1 Tax=bioreactor metagenome TaxID=1076179 RepID=A0A645G7B9_9ZZZZ